MVVVLIQQADGHILFGKGTGSPQATKAGANNHDPWGITIHCVLPARLAWPVV
jgi:hypothetical protein